MDQFGNRLCADLKKYWIKVTRSIFSMTGGFGPMLIHSGNTVNNTVLIYFSCVLLSLCETAVITFLSKKFKNWLYFSPA